MPIAVGVIADSYKAPTGGGWTPASLTGLLAWLDASDTATITHTGGAVSQWNDKSGSGRHHLQATAGHRPITGTRTINARNVIDFDGTDDHLEYTWSVIAQPFTVAAVVQGDAFGSDNRIWARSTTAALMIEATSTVWRYSAGTVRSGTGVPDTAAHVIVACFQATSSRLRLDGVQIHDATAASPGTNGLTAEGYGVGALVTAIQPWNGAIAEMVFTSTNLNGTADLTSLESYLRTKWGLP